MDKNERKACKKKERKVKKKGLATFELLGERIFTIVTFIFDKTQKLKSLVE